MIDDPITVYLNSSDLDYRKVLGKVFGPPQFCYQVFGVGNDINQAITCKVPDVILLDGYSPYHVSLSKSLYLMDSSLSVIFVTDARSSVRVRQKSLEARAVDFIHKSYGRNDYLRLNVQLRGERHQNIQRQHSLEEDLAGRVHDVRSVLATIQLAAKQLSIVYNDPLLEIIVRKCNQGLDFSEVLMGKASLRTLNLDGFLTDYFKHYIPPSFIEFNYDLRCQEEIQADPTLLSRLLSNILHNAEESIEDSGLIVVDSYNRDGRAVIRIADTGKGMTKEHAEKVFESGFSTKVLGHGIGMKVIRSIIEQHGLETRIISSPTKGSSFEFIFPPRK